MKTQKEKWAIIIGFENYAISTYGRIRNLNTGKLLKHLKSKRGGNYPFVDLRNEGKRWNANVHTLVGLHFIGIRPNGYVLHHKDENRSNPHLSNLEYITHKENNHYNIKKIKS